MHDGKCTACNSSRGVCGYNVSNPQQFLCHCRDGHSHPHNCSINGNGSSTRKTFIISSCIGGASALIVAAFLIVWYKSNGFPLSSSSGPTEFEFVQRDIPNLPVFSYQELEQATNVFDKSRELGDGGFGTVYLGKLGDGRIVAVKKLHENNSKRLEQFVNEVRILSSVRHPNLVRLFGYCHERQNLLLVYEYIPNGTLFHHLHGEHKGKGLPWKIRLNIALETANALAYLHFSVDPVIFHRDVKSVNILLDDNMQAKVADFGLSRLVPIESTHVSTVAQGTPGYLDPAYHQCYQLTDKSDVYSFGVVLVELISGKKAVDTTRNSKEIGLAHLAISKIQSGTLHELVDPGLEFESDPLINSMITSCAELAFMCLSLDKDDRPCMMEVVTQLQRIKQIGYGCQNCQNLVLGNKQEPCGKFVTFYSPNTVQTMWSSTSPSPEISA